MITRFFNTSKPIHLVIASLFILVLFFVVRLDVTTQEINAGFILKEFGIYLIVFASIATLSFFVNKNNLTQRNGYQILFFTILVTMLPVVIKDNDIILSNFFVLLALRRIISLRSNLNIKKKLFDAAVWIAVATLFYFWSILFFAVIFAALSLYSISQLKNWIIPIFGGLTVCIIYITVQVLTTSTFGDLANYIEPMDYDFSPYNSIDYIISTTIILSLGVWAMYFYIRKLKDKSKAYRAAHTLVMYAALIAIIIVGITPEKSGSEFLFLFAPLAIIMANYTESVSERWFAEVFVWLLIAVPIVKLML